MIRYTESANEYIKLAIQDCSLISTKKSCFADSVTAFDIETSKINYSIDGKNPVSIMYIWQFAFDTGDGTPVKCIYGRTWEEFKSLVATLNSIGRTIVIHVHNLSFEFQYIKAIIQFDDVMCIDTRRVIKAKTGNVEFRDTAILSNSTLEKFLKNEGVKNKKKTGDLDYSIVRYSDTPLTDDEMGYCENDVVGLVQAVRHKMRHHGDNLNTIPTTSTGYVRREFKEAMKNNKHQKSLNDYRQHGNSRSFERLLEVIKELRLAFRGGNTHANRYYAGRIIENVKSYDRRSSYPAVMCTCKFPMSRFRKYVSEYKINECEKESILPPKEHTHCMLLHMVVERAEVDETVTVPYISSANVKRINADSRFHEDNGRILQGNGFDMWVTDIDYYIIMNQYNLEYYIDCVEIAKADYLPVEMRGLIMKYYRDKTNLKYPAKVEYEDLMKTPEVSEKLQQISYNCQNKADFEYCYALSKAFVNSIYGMTVENPLKPEIEFSNTTNPYNPGNETEEELLKKFMKSKGWLSYAHGVWVTAWARYWLQRGIDLAGSDFVYCDTDSVKFVGDHDFTALNNEIVNEANEMGATAKDIWQGKEYPLGEFELDAEYNKFITLGAKKYCYEKHGKLEITVAGVPKKSVEELKGDINNFKVGFVFTNVGVTKDNHKDERKLHPSYGDCVSEDIIIDGRHIHVSDYATLLPTEYKLGITDDYRHVLDICSNMDKISSVFYKKITENPVSNCNGMV